jgi:hypothetical protein
MPKKPANPSDNPQHRPEELGWDFNNEINFTILEMHALKKAKDKIVSDTEAFEQRLGSLDAIQKFLNRKK